MFKQAKLWSQVIFFNIILSQLKLTMVDGHDIRICDRQTIAQSDFWMSIQSKFITNMWLTNQVQFSKWIDNPIQIQIWLEKRYKQIINGQVLWWNHGIPKSHLFSTYNLTEKLIVLIKKIAWLQCWSMISLFRMTELDCT